MNRRGFLQMLGLGVAGIAVEQAIPFGRVWSFPKEIVIAKPVVIKSYADFVSISDLAELAAIHYDKKALDALKVNRRFKAMMEPRNLPVAVQDRALKMVRFASNFGFTEDLDL